MWVFGPGETDQDRYTYKCERINLKSCETGKKISQNLSMGGKYEPKKKVVLKDELLQL